MGIRYQKNDNPATSPRDRKNFGFDFDQRISLSILGKIGDRLQITANYDTESTFDFQNLVKIQFNPPNFGDLENAAITRLNNKIQSLNNVGDSKNTLEETKRRIQQLKNNFNNLPNSRDQIWKSSF